MKWYSTPSPNLSPYIILGLDPSPPPLLLCVYPYNECKEDAECVMTISEYESVHIQRVVVCCRVCVCVCACACVCVCVCMSSFVVLRLVLYIPRWDLPTTQPQHMIKWVWEHQRCHKHKRTYTHTHTHSHTHAHTHTHTPYRTLFLNSARHTPWHHYRAVCISCVRLFFTHTTWWYVYVIYICIGCYFWIVPYILCDITTARYVFQVWGSFSHTRRADMCMLYIYI